MCEWQLTSHTVVLRTLCWCYGNVDLAEASASQFLSSIPVWSHAKDLDNNDLQIFRSTFSNKIKDWFPLDVDCSCGAKNSLLLYFVLCAHRYRYRK